MSAPSRTISSRCFIAWVYLVMMFCLVTSCHLTLLHFCVCTKSDYFQSLFYCLGISCYDVLCGDFLSSYIMQLIRISCCIHLTSHICNSPRNILNKAIMVMPCTLTVTQEFFYNFNSFHIYFYGQIWKQEIRYLTISAYVYKLNNKEGICCINS